MKSMATTRNTQKWRRFGPTTSMENPRPRFSLHRQGDIIDPCQSHASVTTMMHSYEYKQVYSMNEGIQDMVSIPDMVRVEDGILWSTGIKQYPDSVPLSTTTVSNKIWLSEGTWVYCHPKFDCLVSYVNGLPPGIWKFSFPCKRRFPRVVWQNLV